MSTKWMKTYGERLKEYCEIERRKRRELYANRKNREKAAKTIKQIGGK
jgi:hypothetical protein